MDDLLLQTLARLESKVDQLSEKVARLDAVEGTRTRRISIVISAVVAAAVSWLAKFLPHGGQ